MSDSIDDSTAEQLLHDLVSIPSPSTEEAAAVAHLVAWMGAHGYDSAFRDEAGNAVGVRGAGPREVVLLGHIDTFGGFPTVRTAGRTLYGRGTVDAKGPLCAFAVAAARADLPTDLRVVVIGAVEEEAASSKGARHAVTVYRPDACLIGEPSGWDRITLAYKGRMVIDWQWRGAMAHSAAAVTSAPEHAVAYWQRVRDYADAFNADKEGLFARLDVTLQAINSGQDGAYGWATLTVGFRLPPEIDADALARDLQPEDDAQIRVYGVEQAVVAERNNSVSRALRAAIRAHDGKPRFVHKTGTADMNVVAPVWNCPIAAYGPGDSALDHTPDEHIDLDEYLRSIAVLSEALARF